MKKLLIFACVVLAPVAYAVEPALTIKALLHSTTPSEFGFKGETYLQTYPSIYSEEGGIIGIYDSNLSEIVSINIPGTKEVTLKRWSQEREYDYNDAGEWGPYGKWSEVNEYTYSERPKLFSYTISELNGVESIGVAATQTVFNNDSDFEYLIPKNTIVSTTYENAYGRGGGEYLYQTGYTVMSQSGTALFDIDLPNGYHTEDSHVNISIIGDKKFLIVNAEKTDATSRGDYETEYLIIYALDSNSGISAPKIVSTGMKVSPRLPRRGESVCVDLGETATRVDLIGANGAKVRSVAVEGNNRSVNIPTDGLAPGVYVVTANSREAAKIIIR